MENVEKEWWEEDFSWKYLCEAFHREDGKKANEIVSKIVLAATRRGYEKGLSDADEIICEEMDKTRRVNVSDADFLQWRTETGNAILSRLQALKSSKV